MVEPSSCAKKEDGDTSVTCRQVKLNAQSQDPHCLCAFLCVDILKSQSKVALTQLPEHCFHFPLLLMLMTLLLWASSCYRDLKRQPDERFIMKRLFSMLWLQSSLDDVGKLSLCFRLWSCVCAFDSDLTNEGGRCRNRTYDHMVADVAERGLLEDVLHEAVTCRVYLQRVAWLGAWCGRRSAWDGWRNRRDGEVSGVWRGHPNIAEMARAAAHIGEQLRLVVVAGSEEVVGALAADALGLEGQRALEPLQLTKEKNGVSEERMTEEKT